MNKAREYANFAGWFAGIGYVVLWPLAASGRSGKPFGASVLCADNALTGWLCHASYPLRLPEGLHALGLAAALFVIFRLAIYAIRRMRRRPHGLSRADARTIATVPPSEVPIVPVAVARPRLRPPAPPPQRGVKPRTHFGLRNVPR